MSAMQDIIDEDKRKVLYLAEYPEKARGEFSKMDTPEGQDAMDIAIKSVSKANVNDLRLNTRNLDSFVAEHLGEDTFRGSEEEINAAKTATIVHFQALESKYHTEGFDSLDRKDQENLIRSGFLEPPLTGDSIFYDQYGAGQLYTYDPYDNPATSEIEYNPGSFPHQGKDFFAATGAEGRIGRDMFDPGGEYGYYGYDEAYEAVDHFYSDLEPGEDFDVVFHGHADSYATYGGVPPSGWEEIFADVTEKYGAENKINDVALMSCYMGDNELACGMLAESIEKGAGQNVTVTGQNKFQHGTKDVLAQDPSILQDPNRPLSDITLMPQYSKTSYSGFEDVVNKAIEEQVEGGGSLAGRFNELRTELDYDGANPSENIKLRINELVALGESPKAIAEVLTNQYNQRSQSYYGYDQAKDLLESLDAYKNKIQRLNTDEDFLRKDSPVN